MDILQYTSICLSLLDSSTVRTNDCISSLNHFNGRSLIGRLETSKWKVWKRWVAAAANTGREAHCRRRREIEVSVICTGSKMYDCTLCCLCIDI